MASLEQAAQLPGADADLDSFADPFRKKVYSIFWTKLQKLLFVTWLQGVSLLRRQTQNPGKVMEATGG